MALTRTMQKCVALLLTLLVPVAVMASDWGGTITNATGVVSLNGQGIRGTHTILPGDLINTAKGNAIVRVAGGTISIGEFSGAKFDKSSVVLSNGFAQISGSKELTTHYRDLTIHPVGNEEASFVVGEMQGKPTVATLRGAIMVSDGSGSVILPAGRAIESEPPDEATLAPVAMGQEGQAAEPAVKGRHHPKQEEERGGKKNRKVLSTWWETVIILGAIGALLGGLAAGGVFDRHPASNQSPGPIITP